MMIIYEIPKIHVLLGEENPEPDDPSSVGLIVGIVIGVLAIIGIAAFIIIRYKRKNSNAGPSSSEARPACS